ncbi:sphingoid long-chain bases kinase 1-like isoform X1 [Typha angustifolia]|uniref:sphingoid long-chain bases kinase 1-like isoform X1 n=1 Tax=Typha angustifolia TaxID=59011 RepID=UPI003C2C6639
MGTLGLLDSVSYGAGSRHSTFNSCPSGRRFRGVARILKSQGRKDFCVLTSTSGKANKWASVSRDRKGFAGSFRSLVRSTNRHVSNFVPNDLHDQSHSKFGNPKEVLVIINPHSGHGCSSEVFHRQVEPMFKLAGFKMEVIETTSAEHAKVLASTIDFSTCSDGIICVGGDGVVNEVLNGLLSRDAWGKAISPPIGIIPSGSDNSLVWSVLGVRDPVSAAKIIVKGGCTDIDVFAVKWIQAGISHFGMTASYFGFLSDVLELSEKFRQQFGPLRYFIAGLLKFLSLPEYSFKLEYLPFTTEESKEGNVLEDKHELSMSDTHPRIMKSNRQSNNPRRLRVSTTHTHGLHSKDLLSGKSNSGADSEVVSSNHHLSVATSSPSIYSSQVNENDLRCCSETAVSNDDKNISSVSLDTGFMWNAEANLDTEQYCNFKPNWEAESPARLLEKPNDLEVGTVENEKLEEKWVVKEGKFLGILICNHSCRTMQSLTSQHVVPEANYDDSSLDLLLVHGSGRLRLLRFFISLQFGQHLQLPYVEYIKVKSAKIKPTENTHNGCGIDGELLCVNEQAICSIIPKQFRLLGRPVDHK